MMRERFMHKQQILNIASDENPSPGCSRRRNVEVSTHATFFNRSNGCDGNKKQPQAQPHIQSHLAGNGLV
jgi:hypothetical protein